MKIIRLIISGLVFILSLLALLNKGPKNINLLPYAFLLFGILYIFDAIDFYKINKKIYSVIMLVIALIVIIVSILMFRI